VSNDKMKHAANESWGPTVGSTAIWIHAADSYKSLIPCIIVEFTTRIKIAVRRANNSISFRYVSRDELAPDLSATFLIGLDCDAIRKRLVASNKIQQEQSSCASESK
jgi:hypothetical protein